MEYNFLLLESKTENVIVRLKNEIKLCIVNFKILHLMLHSTLFIIVLIAYKTNNMSFLMAPVFSLLGQGYIILIRTNISNLGWVLIHVGKLCGHMISILITICVEDNCLLFYMYMAIISFRGHHVNYHNKFMYTMILNLNKLVTASNAVLSPKLVSNILYLVELLYSLFCCKLKDKLVNYCAICLIRKKKQTCEDG